MLKLKDIIKNYSIGQNEIVKALKGINVSFGEAGFVSILGPSGCGKTTLLNIVGGLDQYTSGDLIINDVSTINFKDKEWDIYRNKKIGFVFQNYNLIPHLTILENVEMPLILDGDKSKDRKDKAIYALKKVGLENEINKKPNQLSGGQMQRVAIARAIINNPDIVLADEPTGALDTNTSEIVMEILAEISKTKLVIMVTHNEKLAFKYSDRIISMLDGNIVNDTKPYNETQNNEITHKIAGKTSMNLLTSCKIALRNIFTKKGRVAMISVASSFGVIGVGLVLALSNGFTNYIARVEESTASNAPITINKSSISYTAVKNEVEYEKFPEDEKIIVYSQGETVVTKTVHINNINQEFLDYVDNIYNVEEYKDVLAAELITYTSPQYSIVAKNKLNDEYKFVNSNTTVNSITSTLTGLTSLPNTIFHEFYGDQDYIENSYEILEGTYPKNELIVEEDGSKTFEISLVIDQYNRVDKSTLVSLGLISDDSKVEAFDFSDIIGTEFKYYLNDEIYYFNEENPDDTFDTALYRNIEQQDFSFDVEGEKIILSVPQHRAVQYMDFSNSPAELKDLYNGNFKYKKNGIDYTAQPINLRISSILRVQKNAMMEYMPTSLCYTEGFKDYVFEKNEDSNIVRNIKENIKIQTDPTVIQPIIEAFKAAQTEEEILQLLYANFNKCFITFQPLTTLSRLSNGELVGQFNGGYYVAGYERSINLIYGYGGSVELQDLRLKNYVEEQNYSGLAAYLINHPDKIIEFLNYFSGELNSCSRIKSLILFPTTLNNKVLLKEYLDAYNDGKLDSEQIIYTDLVGTLTDGLSQMINIISIVLIIFASISLVVSCVMTGIIMYNSVLERIKEIGILRAVGARKKDVGRLFKTESFIIGTFSGIIGVLFTVLISIPINLILNTVFTDYNIGNIANLAWYAGIILVVISGILSFISGILPARAAARKDPVIALRSE